jgi:hypothetical protein
VGAVVTGESRQPEGPWVANRTGASNIVLVYDERGFRRVDPLPPCPKCGDEDWHPLGWVCAVCGTVVS